MRERSSLSLAFSAALDPTSCWGAEDPRITYVRELGGYAICYTAYGPSGPCVALAVTQDFRSVEHYGIIMPPEDKNASLLPRQIDGMYVLFHRPVAAQLRQVGCEHAALAGQRHGARAPVVHRASQPVHEDHCGRGRHARTKVGEV